MHLVLITLMTLIVSINSQCGIGYQGSPCKPIINIAFPVNYTNSDQIYVGRYIDPIKINKNGFSIHRHLKIKNNYGISNITQ